MSNIDAKISELLCDLAAVMAERRRPWYLFGAQTAIIWGSRRLSTDADATAWIELHEIDAFVQEMIRHGFDCRDGDHAFVEQTRVLRFVHRTTGVPLDVVIAGPGLEDEFLRRAILVDVQKTPIPVMSPEDLIITKILAGRAKDLEDVRDVVLVQKKSLDVERIRSILQLLEQALTRSDLLSVFERYWSD